MAIEIGDLPSYKMVIVHSYVSLPEGNIWVCLKITDIPPNCRFNIGRIVINHWTLGVPILRQTHMLTIMPIEAIAQGGAPVSCENAMFVPS